MDSRALELLDAALSYAARGWRVFPLHDINAAGLCSCGHNRQPDGSCQCKNPQGDPKHKICASPGKHPRTPNGVLDATTDEAQIRKWWTMFPYANIGIATGRESGLMVLDIDERHGGDITLFALREEHGPLPTTITALTGTGSHLYFAHPGGHIPNSAGRLGEGLDLRADGGYVVAPPSLHHSGRLYAWEASCDPGDVPLAPAPAWFLELRAETAKAPIGPILAPGGKIPVGRRREAWKTLSAQLHNDGVPLDGKVRMMMSFAAEMFEQPETAQLSDARGLAAWYEGRDQAFDFTATLPAKTNGNGSDGVAHAPEACRTPEEAKNWPPLPEQALHGLAGDVVRAFEPYTEADPAAILAHFLVFFGNCAGPSPHFTIGGDEHPAKLFAVLVGDSSTGRKGTSEGQVRRLFKAVDPDWTKYRFVQGLASGEALIRVLAPDKEKGASADARAVVVEPEMATILAAMYRKNSTLSSTIRNAWDKPDLELHRASAKNSITARGVHVSVVTHITPGELLRQMDQSESTNGFANRFLWFRVRRSKLLPDAPQIPQAIFDGLSGRLEHALESARRTAEVHRDPAAADLWRQIYPDLCAARPGLAGAVTSRAQAQVLRLSLIYALLDASTSIRPEHVQAALYLFDWTAQCAGLIFGARLGDPLAQRIVDELACSEDFELTRSELGDVLGRNFPALLLESALTFLASHGIIFRDRRPPKGGGRGRPVESFRLIGGITGSGSVSIS